MRSRPRRRLNAAYRTAVVIIKPLLMTLTKRDWRGAEHLPASGGCVVTTNHLSYADPFVFAHFIYDNGREPYFLGKESVFRIPVAGAIVRKSGQIPVYRESGQASEAFRDAVAAVEAGKCVAIYPEGTLTRDPGLWPMRGKTGAARVALLTRCPVIPVAQWGPQEIMAPYTRSVEVFPRKTMHVMAGPPVDLSDLHDAPMTVEVLREATSRIMTAITAQLEILRGETAPAQRFDPREHGVPTTGPYVPPAPQATS